MAKHRLLKQIGCTFFVWLILPGSLQAQHRYSDAIEPLQRAARMIPAPHNRDAWLSLSICFREDGQQELAEVTEMFANTPPIPAEWSFGLRSAAVREQPRLRRRHERKNAK